MENMVILLGLSLPDIAAIIKKIDLKISRTRRMIWIAAPSSLQPQTDDNKGESRVEIGKLFWILCLLTKRFGDIYPPNCRSVGT